MKIVITYDVCTSDAQGQKRLRRVAKICQNYGVRVQNSVFECVVDSTQYVQLKIQLTDVIDKEEDSLRFYKLGDNYRSKIEHIGAKPALEVEDNLIF